MEKIIAVFTALSISLVNITACSDIMKNNTKTINSTVTVNENLQTESKKETEINNLKSENKEGNGMAKLENNIVYAKVNGTILTIQLTENSSAAAFKELLAKGDLTVDMSDYGNFEKVGELGTTLPRNDEQITTSPGDIILYQGDKITIYYDKNSWNFTRLGKIQNTEKINLKSILGSGNTEVTFSIGEN